MSEIRRAVVFDTDRRLDGVACLNEWVTYRIDGSRQSESRILVCPDELTNDQIELSVLSPLGAALLGKSIGQRVKFFSVEGGLHFAIVGDVVAPAGAPLRLSLRSRCDAGWASSDPRGPDDDGPQAA